MHEIDYLVAKAEELQELEEKDGETILLIGEGCFVRRIYHPTTKPEQAWPIIEREGICLNVGMLSHEDNSVVFWNATFDEANLQCGKTSLEAAMRCYVASKFGDSVEI